MTLTNNILLPILFAFFSATLANAASITLKDGRIFKGDIKSQNSETLTLDMDGIEMRLPVKNVAAIDMVGGNTKTESAGKHTTENNNNDLTIIPAGTVITVRMAESVNTRHNKTGQRFTAVLEANLVSANEIVAKKGSKVYGRLTQIKKAGRLVGSASMWFELTEISINDTMVTLKTHPLSGKGENTAKKTLGKTARAAAIGGLIDGSDGAKTGSKVGLGAAILTQGNDIQITKDSLIDFVLSAPLQR